MWLAPGSGYANDFLDQLQRLSTDSTVVMLAIFGVFALLHSGLAYLRPQGTCPRCQRWKVFRPTASCQMTLA